MVQFLLGRSIPDSVRLMSERLRHGFSVLHVHYSRFGLASRGFLMVNTNPMEVDKEEQ